MGQFSKFIAVGLGNTCLSFAVFNVFIHLLPTGPVMVAISQMASYLCGMAASYILNRFWVFSANRMPHSALPKFVAVQIALMFSSSGLIAFTSSVVRLEIEFIWVAVMALITVLNFTFLKKWVFKKS